MKSDVDPPISKPSRFLQILARKGIFFGTFLAS
jgi:hypothetical protein